MHFYTHLPYKQLLPSSCLQLDRDMTGNHPILKGSVKKTRPTRNTELIYSQDLSATGNTFSITKQPR